jgi:hypothetical protein
MKAKLKAKVLEIIKNSSCIDDGGSGFNSMVKLKITSRGKVETYLNNAQITILQGNIFLKEAIANSMKIGGNITITISDEEDSEL